MPSVSLPPGLTATAGCAGAYHTCVLLNNGSIVCFGRNHYGQLGIGNINSIGEGPGQMGSNLTLVQLPDSATQVSCGQDFGCAMLASQKIACWGYNNYGQLGIGNANPIGDGPGEMGSNMVLVALPTGLNATSVACGYSHTCAMLTDGNIYCIGYNALGQLDLDTTASISSPSSAAQLPSTFKPTNVYFQLHYSR